MFFPRIARLLWPAVFLSLSTLAAPAQTTDYGNSGPWVLSRTMEGGQVWSCHATMTMGPATAMIFDHTTEYTSIGFRTPRSGEGWEIDEVEVWFDNNRGGGQLLSMPAEQEWRVYRSPNTEPDGVLDLLANANSISFSYVLPGGVVETATFPLQGSNAMTKQTYACVQGGQSAPAAMPAPATFQPYQWTWFTPGMLGPDLISAGTMPDGMPVYVCQAHIEGGSHPGMTGMWSDSCSVGYGGVEVKTPEFSVMPGVGSWQPYNGSIPANVILGGVEANGLELFVCRVKMGSSVIVGKFRQGFSGCNYGDGGSEVSDPSFDLLTY